jgi:hypothetical protein
MNIEQFWMLVEKVHSNSPHDMETKCRFLGQELRLLPLDEVLSFESHFTDLFFRAFTWDIWGAACVICDGCGDDSFMDFRSTLISLGRAVYATALADADSLAEFDIQPEWATYEGYQYVAGRVCEERGRSIKDESAGHPQEPIGSPFNQWEMSNRFPLLVSKYGYKDSDWLFEKERQQRDAKRLQLSKELATFLLDSGIISPRGLIPPPRILRPLLRLGRITRHDGTVSEWPPFELDENLFWPAVRILEDTPVEQLTPRPELQARSLHLDTTAAEDADYNDWLRRLSGSIR